MNRLRWGIISTAKIGVDKVIPAMQQGERAEIVAIASRDGDRAKEVAGQLGIPRSYGSYQELLADPYVQAVYNPLPNHLHVPVSIQALAAGKHVLCEKPLGLNAGQAQELADAAAQHPELRVMEAFMYRHHPQWQRAKQIVDEGGIGRLWTVNTFFSYYNDDPHNVRNMADIGGGGLMDIGCYCISFGRWVFGREPGRVCGVLDYDPNFRTDRMASGILDFGEGTTATFTCSTQLSPYQRSHLFGEQGRVEIEIPCNAPPNRPCRIWHQRGEEVEEIVFPIADQYTLQGDLFSAAVLEDQPVPTPLSDAVANMRVIDAIVRSHEQRQWVDV